MTITESGHEKNDQHIWGGERLTPHSPATQSIYHMGVGKGFMLTTLQEMVTHGKAGKNGILPFALAQEFQKYGISQASVTRRRG